MDEREELKNILYPDIDKGDSVVGEVLSWHSRHRPSFVCQCFNRTHVCPGGPDRPKVSREQVEKVLHRTYREQGVGSVVVNELLSLLNGEKLWCQHLEWDEGQPIQGDVSWPRWTVKSRKHPDGKVSPQWTLHDGNYCPICGKERPKE